MSANTMLETAREGYVGALTSGNDGLATAYRNVILSFGPEGTQVVESVDTNIAEETAKARLVAVESAKQVIASVTVAMLAKACYTIQSVRLSRDERLENEYHARQGKPLPASATENQVKASDAWALLHVYQDAKKTLGEEFRIDQDARTAIVEGFFGA